MEGGRDNKEEKGTGKAKPTKKEEKQGFEELGVGEADKRI